MFVPSMKRSRRLELELLEDRIVPAVIDVISTVDNNNPVITAGHAGTAADPFLAPSLRSAISFVNASTTGSNNVIDLTVAGTYKITLAGTPGETDNLAGELAILPSGTNGSSLAIVNTSGGTAIVDGGSLNNRVFDVNPNNITTSPKFSVTMTGFTIQNGLAQPGDGPNGSGGGIRDQGNVSLTLTSMVVQNNSASADGGAVSMENAPASTPWTLTVTNSIIRGNHAGDAGGGFETDGTGKVFITNSQLLNNTCVNQGAAVWLDAIGTGSANLTMTGDLVRGNAALNGPTGAIGNAGTGAVTITSCTIEHNSSGTTGGGFGDENNLGTLTVTNSAFLDNSAVGNGGGIQEGGPSTTITSSLIEGNSTGAAGGGIFANGVTLTITSSSIIGNMCAFTSASPPFQGGGGIEIQTTGSLTQASSITNSTIANNSVLNNAGNNNGGGIDASASFQTGTLALLGDTITGNYADTGGGFYWAANDFSFVTMENTIIAGNNANVAGPDAYIPIGPLADKGGNLIGISGAGSGNTGFIAATTQTGTVATPLNPKLGPLQNNGGPTVGASAAPTSLLTQVPLVGSPAIGKGVAAGSPGIDERGYLNPASGSGNPTVGAVEFLTAQERFVQALYLDELGRPGTTAELDAWVNVLNGPGGQQAVARAIDSSFEARDHLVKTWYQTFLDRQAVGGEETGWASLLSSQTEEQVLAQLLGGQEFFSRAQTFGFGDTPQGNYIRALYQVLLGRAPTAGEETNGLALLMTQGQTGVALDLLRTQEYRALTVTGYYVSLLHRATTPFEVSPWAVSALDLGMIRVGFEASPEFFRNG